MDPETNEEEIFIGTPPEITQSTREAANNLLPEKSRYQYERVYNIFDKWRKLNHVAMNFDIQSSLAEKLRCKICKNCLVVLPVYEYSDLTFSCGNCTKQNAENIHESSLFNILSPHLNFPCKYKYMGCPERIKPSKNKSQDHEKNCQFRLLKCPFFPELCKQDICAYLMTLHIQKEHENFVITDSRFTPKILSSTTIYNKRILSAYDKCYILHEKCENSNYYMGITSLFSSEFNYFEVKFILNMNDATMSGTRFTSFNEEPPDVSKMKRIKIETLIDILECNELNGLECEIILKKRTFQDINESVTFVSKELSINNQISEESYDSGIYSLDSKRVETNRTKPQAEYTSDDDLCVDSPDVCSVQNYNVIDEIKIDSKKEDSFHGDKSNVCNETYTQDTANDFKIDNMIQSFRKSTNRNNEKAANRSIKMVKGSYVYQSLTNPHPKNEKEDVTSDEKNTIAVSIIKNNIELPKSNSSNKIPESLNIFPDKYTDNKEKNKNLKVEKSVYKMSTKGNDHFDNKNTTVRNIKMSKSLKSDKNVSSNTSNLDNDLLTASIKKYPIKKLLTKGANPSVSNDKKFTPLHYESARGHANRVQDLITAGANINAQNIDGNTPLHLAVKEQHLQCVITILFNEETDCNLQNKNGWTALHFVCFNGDVKCLIELLKRNADYNIKNNDGNTPLLLACIKQQNECMEKLLKYKASPNETQQNKITLLHIACAKSDLMAIKLLLDAKANPNSQDDDGETPLHVAVAKGNVKSVQTLIEKEADCNIDTKQGSTPLHYASEMGHSECVIKLLAAKSDPNRKDKRGYVPLQLTKDQKCRDLLKQVTTKTSYFGNFLSFSVFVKNWAK